MEVMLACKQERLVVKEYGRPRNQRDLSASIMFIGLFYELR